MHNPATIAETIKQGDLEAIKKMIAEEPALLRAKEKGELSPLLLSAYHGKTAITRWLRSQDIGPLTIWEAAAVGDLERVETLLEEDPTLLDKHAADGFTPLGLAAFFAQVDTLSLLLRHGADPNVPSQNEMRVRPIHSAAANRRPDVAVRLSQHLLKAGADPNVAQRGGWTPLHQAADHGNLELVQLLLDHNADPDLRSEDGRSPADMARAKGFDEVVAGLRRYSRG